MKKFAQSIIVVIIGVSLIHLTKDIIDFTKEFKCEVTIKDGYLADDFTVYLKKISSPF